MWEDSIYRFRIPYGEDADGAELYKEVVFDVTLSAPRFEEPPSNIIRDCLDPFFNEIMKKKKINVLDFGAGKLRYTLWFLKRGYQVCAVEYENLETRSPQMRSNLGAAKKSGANFKSLKYPHEFIKAPDDAFDLAVLINVINTIPVPYERLLVLKECYKKLKTNAYLISITWSGISTWTAKFTDDNEIGDGYYMGENTYFKSFAKEYKDEEELDEFALAAGFVFSRKFAVSGNKARLYQKKSGRVYSLFDRVIKPSNLKKFIPKDKDIEDPADVLPKIEERQGKKPLIIANPEELSMEYLYAELLKNIPTGKRSALKYQRLVFLILGRLFRPYLRDFKIEKTTDIERIDITARNKAQEGFWAILANKIKIPCNWVMFECKNIKSDPKNPEFAQISSRLNDTRGKFGVLIFRTTSDVKVLKKQCEHYMRDSEYILPLDDKDILIMLDLKIKGLDEDLDSFINDKFEYYFF
jgi:SAM-dependent methyltransferase